MLAAGTASLSARLMVERSDRQDAELARRLDVLEGQIRTGTLPLSDERIKQLRRDFDRLEKEVELNGQHP